MILSLTGSLTGTKLVMSELMIPSLNGTKLESLYGDVGQDGLFIFSYTLMECRSLIPSLTGSFFWQVFSGLRSNRIRFVSGCSALLDF